MTVLLVNISIDRVTGGGTASRTLELAKSITDEFAERCIVLSTDHGLERNFKNEDHKYDVVLLPTLTNRFCIPIFSWNDLKDLVHQSDVIHIMSHWTIINVIVYVIARKLGKPYTFCPAGTLKIFGRSKYLKKIYNFVVGRKIVRNALCCIAITESEKSDFSGFNIDDECIRVIPNGINLMSISSKDEQSLSIRSKLSLKKSEKYILFMGRLNYIKGPDILLDAFVKLSTEYSDVHLVFAGPDEGLAKKLHLLISEASLQNRVHLIGYVGGLEKTAAYMGASLLVIPSRREAMSIVALEAGACSTPVILTTTCGFDEVSDVGCLVVEPDSESIYNAMHNMLSPLTDLSIIGSDFHSFIMGRYSWKKSAEKYLNLFRSD